MIRFRALWTALALLVSLSAPMPRAAAQAPSLEGRPVARVEVRGTDRVDPQLILNQIRLQAGQPFDAQVVERDIQNITRLGRFGRIDVERTINPDGSVNVVYVVEELPLIRQVKLEGNRVLLDNQLKPKLRIQAGDPRDPFLIDQARNAIVKAYREAGYYLSNVAVDQDALDKDGTLILRVREGPRVKIRRVGFEGNDLFTDAQLRSQIKAKPYAFIFSKGVLNRELLEQDVAALRKFYLERGYLDVRIGYRLDLADNQIDAEVLYLVKEGPRYTVSNIRIEGNVVFPTAELLGAIPLKLGDIFSEDRLRKSREAIADLYGRLGYLDTQVIIRHVPDRAQPKVDVRVMIRETQRTRVGAVIVRGNRLTQDKVIRRQVRGMEPGRHYDQTGIEKTERRIMETGLFREAKVTLLGEENDEVRDALIEVEEGNTGSMSFGAAVSSDSGFFGAIDITQRNFDIHDPPESLGEYLAGRAFRGAGQYFRLEAQPGSELQRYQLVWREPFFQDGDFFLETRAFLFERRREDWEEQRIGTNLSIGKRFGDVWSLELRARYENVEIDDIEPEAPLDVFAVAGRNTVDSLGLFLHRNTTDSRFLPTTGERFTAGIEKIGWMNGDFDFWRATVEYSAYTTLDEDFLGRKNILAFRVNTGHIWDVDPDAPTYERFFAGGHRTFRGFDFRGVGPRGIRADTLTVGDDGVGGDFMFLAGVEYSYPLMGDSMRGVWFVDTGTVNPNASLDNYRVSVGGGIRLKMPFAGQAPFAFDLAVPVVKEDGDERRTFSFDIALPF